MKHLIKLCVAAVLMFPTFAKANEGMWLVSLLNKMNEAEMRGMGLNLTAEEIYSINKASLKSRIGNRRVVEIIPYFHHLKPCYEPNQILRGSLAHPDLRFLLLGIRGGQ